MICGPLTAILAGLRIETSALDAGHSIEQRIRTEFYETRIGEKSRLNRAYIGVYCARQNGRIFKATHDRYGDGGQRLEMRFSGIIIAIWYKLLTGDEN